MWNRLIVLVWVLAPVTLCQTGASGPDKVVCYFGSWASYRHGNGRFNIEDIDAHQCTHVIYSFIGINADGTVNILDPWNEIGLDGLNRFNNLKAQNPNLKTLIAIGGWNEGSIGFSKVAASPALRSNLAASALQFMDLYGFDGFDFDWEYPAQRGGSWDDKANFVELVKTCREAFDHTGNHYLITAAVAATGTAADLSYDVPALSKYLDFINIMAYDLHAFYDGVTGQNAPLYPSATEMSGYLTQLNVVASVNAWLQRGAPPQKLVLGLGAYGKSYTLASASNHGLGAPSINGGIAGKYTAESGTLSYLEICELQKEGGWTIVWDDRQKVPYMYKNDQWVGFDNVQSIKLKVEFAKSLNLGGLMLWSIEMEDSRGICGQKYPLLTAVNEGIHGSGPPIPTSAPGGTTTTTTTTTEASAGSGSECTKEGFMRDIKVCSVFYYCAQSGGEFQKSTFKCSGSLVFNTVNQVCDYPSNVVC